MASYYSYVEVWIQINQPALRPVKGTDRQTQCTNIYTFSNHEILSTIFFLLFSKGILKNLHSFYAVIGSLSPQVEGCNCVCLNFCISRQFLFIFSHTRSNKILDKKNIYTYSWLESGALPGNMLERK